MKKSLIEELTLYFIITFSSLVFFLIYRKDSLSFFVFGYLLLSLASGWMALKEKDNKVIVHSNESYMASILIKAIFSIFLGFFIFPFRFPYILYKLSKAK